MSRKSPDAASRASIVEDLPQVVGYSAVALAVLAVIHSFIGVGR